MELSHRFTVPTPVDETWAHFEDIAAVAECFPGAQVTSAEGDSFAGSVKVKLGPIALVYNGTGTFVEKDEATKRFVVDAQGKDKRGNGTAGAHVKVSMADVAGSTEVSVDTDLAITGKPAQFGRGVMQDVSDKLLGQFVACLEARLSDPPAAETTSSDTASDTSGDTSGGTAGDEPATAVPSSGGSATAPAPERFVEPPASPYTRTRAPEPEALDLGSAILPILAKTYWKPALGTLAGVVVVWWLVRR